MKRNYAKNKRAKNVFKEDAKERLSNFQRKSPHKFRSVFESVQKGKGKLKSGAVNEAKTDFEAALTIYPEYIPALNYLAVVYGILACFSDGLAQVKKVIKLDGKNVFALIQGAIFSFRLNKEREAIFYSEQAVNAFRKQEGHDPYHDYDMLQKLTEMLAVLGKDRELAELYYEKKAYLSSISMYYAGLALSNLGNYFQACTAFNLINSPTELKERSKLLVAGLQLYQKQERLVPRFSVDDAKGFNEFMETLSEHKLIAAETTEACDELEVIKRQLETLKKDQLIETVKKHELKGYSKLNKNGLIQLIITEVYEKGLWK